MSTFYDLNKRKLKYVFMASSLSFLVILSIVFTIGYFVVGVLPDRDLLTGILLTGCIGIPFLGVIISGLFFLYRQSRKRKAFAKTPFDQLESIGFYASLVNEQSKWLATEEINEGTVNGFRLKANLSNEKLFVIEIQAAVAWKKLAKDEFNGIKNKFKRYNMEFIPDGLVKKYNTKRCSMHTIQELKRDLEEFTELLQQEGFKPRIDNKQAKINTLTAYSSSAAH